MATNIHLKLENRIRVCREYAELWQTYFTYFSEDFEERQITEELERDFENVMNVLALNFYKLQELCGPYMKELDSITKILCETVSLEALKAMPEATRSKLLVEWHRAFIDMNKALGKMLSSATPKQLEALRAQGLAAIAEAPAPAQQAEKPPA